MDIDARQVLHNWEEIKKLEKSSPSATRRTRTRRTSGRHSALDACALEAAKLGSKAAKSGFDWPDVSGLIGKLREETAELEAEHAVAPSKIRS